MASLPGFSAAGTALGFGANALANQFQLEDEQARKKRLAAMNAAQGGSLASSWPRDMAPLLVRTARPAPCCSSAGKWPRLRGSQVQYSTGAGRHLI